MICLSALFVLIGLAMIFARDFMWELTVFGNQMSGRTSERTELWDTGQMISGGLLVLIGAGLICWQISEGSAEAAQQANATATATTLLTELEESFAPYISQWQQNERQNAYRVSPRDVRVLAQGIYYGRCASNRFYIYVMGFQGRFNNYAYVPDSEPQYCAPAGLSISSVDPIGNDWYSFFAFGTPEATRAARPATATPEATEE